MLVTTNLIPRIEKILDSFQKQNYFGIQPPIELAVVRKKQNKAWKLSYKFRANPKFLSEQWKYQLGISLLIVLAISYQYMFESSDSFLQTHNAFKVFANSSFTFLILFFKIHSEGLARFLNILLEYEGRHCLSSYGREYDFPTFQTNSKWMEDHLRLFQTCLQRFPILMGIRSFVFPLSPARLLPSFFFKGFGIPFPGNLVLGTLRRFLNGIFTLGAMQVGCNCCLIAISLSSLVCPFALNALLVNFRSILRSKKDVLETVLVYRETQLAFFRFNEVHQRELMPFLISLVVVTFSVSSYILVAFHQNAMGIIIVLVIIMLVMSFAVLGTCFTLMMYVDVTSSSIISSRKGLLEAFLKQGQHYSRKGSSSGVNGTSFSFKLLRKFWKSFPPLRIYFFSNNFFEKGTPLNVLNFSINLTVNFILMERE